MGTYLGRSHSPALMVIQVILCKQIFHSHALLGGKGHGMGTNRAGSGESWVQSKAESKVRTKLVVHVLLWSIVGPSGSRTKDMRIVQSDGTQRIG
jgi:hypothetical protein